MNVAALALIGVGTLVQTAANFISGSNQAQAAELNASEAQRQATIARQQSVEDARRLQIEGRQSIGNIRANVGASGVTTEGSPMDVLEQSAANVELDRLTVLHAGETRGANYDFQAQYSRFAANAASSQKWYGSAATLLSGSGKALFAYNRLGEVD